MTFINRRIIKRPTLFASSRRDLGNLLEKYEAGQNSASASGRQLTSIYPEPTFTTSWTKSGLTISADLLGIANAHSCLLYTSPSPRDLSTSRMPSSA